MNSINNEGVYTKTQAYNFLKGLLGLQKRDVINKNFFFLFFRKEDSFPGEKIYSIRKPEDMVKKIFAEKHLAGVNRIYYAEKKRNNKEKAQNIAQATMKSVWESTK
jgi:hypothetical protein